MATKQVGPDHAIARVIHVQIHRDDQEKDPDKAFSAHINAPGFSLVVQISNGKSTTFKLPGVNIGAAPVDPTVAVEVDDFGLLPGGSTPATAKALHFVLVFKLVEIFRITIGSIPVTAAL